MLARLHERRGTQLLLGLAIGTCFGFLLQKGGAASYDVIIGQLLLTDFTVVKIMLSAVIVGMIGVHLLRSLGLAQLHPKVGSVGSTILGALIFGVGFGVLGYCPGTVAAAVGEGAVDAAAGGVVGIILGTWLFAVLYPGLSDGILVKGVFGDVTLPDILKVNAWAVVLPAAGLLAGLLWWIESAGL
jgi:hypothetical protein